MGNFNNGIFSLKIITKLNRRKGHSFGLNMGGGGGGGGLKWTPGHASLGSWT